MNAYPEGFHGCEIVIDGQSASDWFYTDEVRGECYEALAASIGGSVLRSGAPRQFLILSRAITHVMSMTGEKELIGEPIDDLVGAAVRYIEFWDDFDRKQQ